MIEALVLARQGLGCRPSAQCVVGRGRRAALSTRGPLEEGRRERRAPSRDVAGGRDWQGLMDPLLERKVGLGLGLEELETRESAGQQ